MKNHIYKALAVGWIMVLVSPCFAQYNPVLGRFHQRDPLGVRPGQATFVNGAPYLAGNSVIPGISHPTRIAFAPAAAMIQTDPVASIKTTSGIDPPRQYQDGMNIYEYVGSKVIILNDAYGTLSCPFNIHKVDSQAPKSWEGMSVLGEAYIDQWSAWLAFTFPNDDLSRVFALVTDCKASCAYWGTSENVKEHEMSHCKQAETCWESFKGRAKRLDEKIMCFPTYMCFREALSYYQKAYYIKARWLMLKSDAEEIDPSYNKEAKMRLKEYAVKAHDLYKSAITEADFAWKECVDLYGKP